MKYELARQLKETGYPFKIGHTEGKAIHFDETVVYAVTTLSELIEACGDRFEYLHRVHRGCWTAGTEDILTEEEEEKRESLYQSTYEVGSTPEEAVAKLWLELNKKL